MNPRSARLVALLGLALVLLPLYLVPGARLGFWEPWETDIASLAWLVATEEGQSAFAPVRDGQILARPWLETVLAVTGFRLGGGSEWGFRLPFALLHLGTLLAAFGLLHRTFGVWRTFAGLLLTGLAPAVFLGSISLAGHAVACAPIALFLLTATLAARREGNARPALIVAAGVCLGFSVWGMGLAGFAIATGTIGLLAVGSRDAEAPRALPWMAGGAALALLSIGWPVTNLLLDGWMTLGDQGRTDASLAEVAQEGWTRWKELLAVWIAIGVPAGFLLAALPGSTLRRLWHPVATPVATLLAALLVLAPLQAIQAVLVAQGEELPWAMPFLVFQSTLSEQVLPDHVTFDVLIRIAGFGLYPTVLFLPFAMGYLLRTSDADTDQTDDADDTARLVKRLFLLWTAVAFVVGGLATTLARQSAFPLALPVAMSAALALTDRRFLRALAEHPAVLRAAGVAGVFLLLVLSKDIRGTFNEELGRPGPHVLFESLLLDGNVAFPDDYAFRRTSLFVGAWALTILLLFLQPLTYVHATLRDLADGDDDAPGLLARGLRPLRRLAARLAEIAGSIRARLDGALGERAPQELLFGLFLAITLAWTAQLALLDVGRLTHHFSQRGLIETLERFAGEDDRIHAVAIETGNASYYLRDDVVERVPRLRDLVDLFCDAQQEGSRVFAVLRSEDLPEAYQLLREQEREDCTFDDLPVLDGRSSRYLLVSNELHPDRGEEQQSFISDNVFTDETLPAEAVRPEVRTIVDERLELAASHVASVDGGRFIEITTYWRVLQRPRGNYQSFIHIDYTGNRLNGDHDLVEGRFPMNRWVVGDIVRDVYRVKVSRADKAGLYTVYYGFFRGNDRLTVTEPTVRENRIDLGQVRVGR